MDRPMTSLRRTSLGFCCAGGPWLACREEAVARDCMERPEPPPHPPSAQTTAIMARKGESFTAAYERLSVAPPRGLTNSPW
jgi:hypothetical protein